MVAFAKLCSVFSDDQESEAIEVELVPDRTNTSCKKPLNLEIRKSDTEKQDSNQDSIDDLTAILPHTPVSPATKKQRSFFRRFSRQKVVYEKVEETPTRDDKSRLISGEKAETGNVSFYLFIYFFLSSFYF